MNKKPSQKLSEKLIQFAAFTLAILERDKDWDANTISDIGKAARVLGLSSVDENGAFCIQNVEGV